MESMVLQPHTYDDEGVEIDNGGKDGGNVTGGGDDTALIVIIVIASLVVVGILGYVWFKRGYLIRSAVAYKHMQNSPGVVLDPSTQVDYNQMMAEGEAL